MVLCLQIHGELLDVVMRGMQAGLLIGHESPLNDAFPNKVFSVAVVEEKIIVYNLRYVPTRRELLLKPQSPRDMKYSSTEGGPTHTTRLMHKKSSWTEKKLGYHL